MRVPHPTSVVSGRRGNAARVFFSSVSVQFRLFVHSRNSSWRRRRVNGRNARGEVSTLGERRRLVPIRSPSLSGCNSCPLSHLPAVPFPLFPTVRQFNFSFCKGKYIFSFWHWFFRNSVWLLVLSGFILANLFRLTPKCTMR